MILLNKLILLLILFSGIVCSAEDPFVWSEVDYEEIQSKNEKLIKSRLWGEIEAVQNYIYFRFVDLDIKPGSKDDLLLLEKESLMRVGDLPFLNKEFVEEVSKFYDSFSKEKLVFVSYLSGVSTETNRIVGFRKELKHEFSELPPVYGIFGFSPDALLVSMVEGNVKFVVAISNLQETAMVKFQDGTVIYPLRMRAMSIKRLESMLLKGEDTKKTKS